MERNPQWNSHKNLVKRLTNELFANSNTAVRNRDPTLTPPRGHLSLSGVLTSSVLFLSLFT